SNIEAIVPGFDYYFIPVVLNSQDKKWMMDIHHEAIKEYREYLDFAECLAEGYCIFNEDAKVYQKTNCTKPTVEDALAYAYVAENFVNLPGCYVEYSGKYGDVDIVREASEVLNDTLLLYGGGITTLEHAKEMKQYADVIIVGNVIYEDIDQAIET